MYYTFLDPAADGLETNQECLGFLDDFGDSGDGDRVSFFGVTMSCLNLV